MKIESCNLENIKLENGLFNERALINKKYLMELNSTCLLQNFYLEAGIILPGLQIINDPSKVKLHWGWEAPSCQLRGHFLGHWLSAASFLIAQNKDEELKIKLNYIIDELEKCQQINGGKWIGSIPEKYFKWLEQDSYIWSPQYTIHKTLLGLTHSYQYAKNEKALKIVNNMADWFIEWTNKMKKECPKAIHKGEEGGMLEIWATLYQITKEEKYLKLIKCYYEPELFVQLLEKKDSLTNVHCNATIPHIHGAAKMYEITNDKKWLNIVLNFWEIAVEKRKYYCTGSMNAGEYWIPPKKQGEFIGERNQEFCTVFNMVRLADYLFKFTGDKKFCDFIELNIYNGFLAQQNKNNGMPTYFLPMKSGSKKIWGSKTNDFWCCHGSMIQAQTLYPTLCYYKNENNEFYINQYIPSSLKYDTTSIKLDITQNCAMKYNYDTSLFQEKSEGSMSRWLTEFNINSNEIVTLKFRIPQWCKFKPIIKINNKIQNNITIEKDYFTITKKWNNESLTLYFPSSLEFSYTDDIKNLAAITDGPIVLAGLCTGNKPLKLDSKNKSPDTILIAHNEHIYTSFPWLQNNYRTIKQEENFELKPLYEITDETYTLYFDIHK